MDDVPENRKGVGASGVFVENPRCRVPLSLVIDDSTCLVNLAHFGIPHFAAVYPERYQQDWRSMPREIPDLFVREFGEWCHDRGIKGKYSVVPFPACVGWIDESLPGWTKEQLQESLGLVRELLVPNWDIHPEMISHTKVIDTKTGLPFDQVSPNYMENWGWTDGKSADELADYLSFALRRLKNVGFTCDGVTTPGAFGKNVLNELSLATLQSCREVFRSEIAHYFHEVRTEGRSVKPEVEIHSGSATDCTVAIIGCSKDWFGGWDGLRPGSADLFITEDLKGGRLPEVIQNGEPAVMLCHWPGMYYNGEKLGFEIFKTVVQRLNDAYDNIQWMKLSEIARYWAARELTKMDRVNGEVRLNAPFSCPSFTVRMDSTLSVGLKLESGNLLLPLERVGTTRDLQPGTWAADGGSSVACFDLPEGESALVINPSE